MSKYNIAHQLGTKPRTNDVLLSEEEDVDFSSMLLPNSILEGLSSAGFVKPSPIQLKAIPLARCGFDLIVQAKSGTGKTCVFSVTALENVALESTKLQVIVLAPTREIAQQIQHVLSTIGKNHKSLHVGTFIGGVPLSEDKINVKNCQIAVGAPGRLKHLIEEKILLTDAVRLVVLDEADKLMEETFQNDINFIFQNLPESKQVIACSATYTQDLMNFLGNYMQSATHVQPSKDPSPILIGLRHYLCVETASFNDLSRMKIKEASLLKILKNVPFLQCLVFSNYHSRAESICNGLKRNGWKVSWIAGKQKQETRTNVMTNMKDLKVRVLVTTDLTARGIDLHEVNLVINMDVPEDHQTYLHRMGRAGRYGGHGLVITIVTNDEMDKFRRLLGKIGGSYASAYVIPDSKPSDKLWSMNITECEQIVGIPVDDEEDDDNNCAIKQEQIENEKEVVIKNESETESGEKYSAEDSNEDDNVIEDHVLAKNSNENEPNSDMNVTDNAPEITFLNGIKSEGDETNTQIFSACTDKEIDRESISCNSSLSDFCGNNETFSSTDDEDQPEETVCSEDEYNNEIEKFMTKLIDHKPEPIKIRSFAEWKESFDNFTEKKLNDNEPIKYRLLEPSGANLSSETIERCLNEMKDDQKRLMKLSHSWDTKEVLNWLTNDTTGQCLHEVFTGDKITDSEIKCEGKDPELNSPFSTSSPASSSSSSSSCDDDGDIDDDDDDSVNKINSEHNQSSKIIESKLNKSDVDRIPECDGNLPEESFEKEHFSDEISGTKYSTKDVENGFCNINHKPDVNSVDKSTEIGEKSEPSSSITDSDNDENCRKRHCSNNLHNLLNTIDNSKTSLKKIRLENEISEDSSESDDEDSDGCNNDSEISIHQKSRIGYKTNNFMKNLSLHNEMKEHNDKIAEYLENKPSSSKRTNSGNNCKKSLKKTSKRQNFNNLENIPSISGINNYNTHASAYSFNNQQSYPYHQYYSTGYVNNNNTYRTDNLSFRSNYIPKEVENWYNKWYRQVAILHSCAKYNQFMNYSLNQ